MVAEENYQQMYYIYLPPCSKSFFKIIALRPTSVGLVIQIIAYRIQMLPSPVVVLCALGLWYTHLLQQKEAHLLCGAKNLLLLQLKF